MKEKKEHNKQNTKHCEVKAKGKYVLIYIYIPFYVCADKNSMNEDEIMKKRK